MTEVETELNVHGAETGAVTEVGDQRVATAKITGTKRQEKQQRETRN